MKLDEYDLDLLRIALRMGNGHALALCEGLECADDQGLEGTDATYFALVYAQEMLECLIDEAYGGYDDA